jgi:hypothetical protein
MRFAYPISTHMCGFPKTCDDLGLPCIEKDSVDLMVAMSKH